MKFASTGMTNYTKGERLVRVAGDRNLKIVGIGDIAVMFRSRDSIIPLKLCNVEHVQRFDTTSFRLPPSRKEVTDSLAVKGGL